MLAGASKDCLVWNGLNNEKIDLTNTTSIHSEIHINAILKIFNFDFWIEIDAVAILCLLCCC